jgi:hypothetical protein
VTLPEALAEEPRKTLRQRVAELNSPNVKMREATDEQPVTVVFFGPPVERQRPPSTAAEARGVAGGRPGARRSFSRLMITPGRLLARRHGKDGSRGQEG